MTTFENLLSLTIMHYRKSTRNQVTFSNISNCLILRTFYIFRKETTIFIAILKAWGIFVNSNGTWGCKGILFHTSSLAKSIPWDPVASLV